MSRSANHARKQQQRDRQTLKHVHHLLHRSDTTARHTGRTSRQAHRILMENGMVVRGSHSLPGQQQQQQQ